MRTGRLTNNLGFLLLGIELLFLCTGSIKVPLKSSDDEEELCKTQRDPPQDAAVLCTIQCCSTYCVIFALVNGSAFALVLAIGCKCKKGAIKKKKDLVEKEAELKKQSKKTQEELDAWVAVTTPSMELKIGLGNQREEFRKELEKIEKEREESKEKLGVVEKEIAESEKEKATDKTEGYLREKQILLNAQWKLEKRKEELEKQQLNMEKLLQKTEGLMATITERKSKVENHMELINLHLEEVESEDITTHLHRK